MKTKNQVLQFRVSLKEIEPEVWRRIVVPRNYSFWDLHVAIQDAMGWWDYHLHSFRIRNPKTGGMDEIGIPDDPPEDDLQFIAGWEVPISGYFRRQGDRGVYEYDFGDVWEHELVFEGVLDRIPGKKYPLCLDGARACPPEDCGGPRGYDHLLAVLRDPAHEEHEEMVEWLDRKYDPAAFSSKAVQFDDPGKRWRKAFQS